MGTLLSSPVHQEIAIDQSSKVLGPRRRGTYLATNHSSKSLAGDAPTFVMLQALYIRSFEKGLEDRGGWRQEVLSMPEIEATFLYPFSYGTHFWRTFFGCFWGFVRHQPPPLETSDLQQCILYAHPYKQTHPEMQHTRNTDFRGGQFFKHGHPCRSSRWTNNIFCANFGRGKIYREVPVKYFESAGKGLKTCWTRFFLIFAFFKPFSVLNYLSIWGQFRSADVPP